MSTPRRTLSEGDKIGYSERERRLFRVIAGRVRITTSDLVGKGLSESFHARQSIVASLVGLARKMDANRETHKLCRSERRGPHPSEWWLEAR